MNYDVNNQIFSWLKEVLADFTEDDHAKNSHNCSNPELEQFLATFDYELLTEVLQFSDEELEREFPFDPCPVTMKLRNQINEILKTHVSECKACRLLVLERKLIELSFEFKVHESAQCDGNYDVALY
jgi:hypothetical protein